MSPAVKGTAAPRPRKPRRTPVVQWRRKRTLEGGDFEVHSVMPPLEAVGFVAVASRLSRGPYDVSAWRPPHLLIVAARLTGVSLDGTVATNPSFSAKEQNTLWELSLRSTPGFQVVPLIATARHAAAPGRGCECSGLPSDPVRFMALTGPSAGPGRAPNWRAWSPEDLLELERAA
ncbi:hypothetical protein [Frankia sp. CcI49]|uniref:hypothetical protein n=1 Tax=Frankia sp. CcI49 TaxID=1745382 RepID=UPI001055A5EB|nr:hypothetical protein [Frankia sp. CcI49]